MPVNLACQGVTLSLNFRLASGPPRATPAAPVPQPAGPARPCGARCTRRVSILEGEAGVSRRLGLGFFTLPLAGLVGRPAIRRCRAGLELACPPGASVLALASLPL